MKKINMLLAVIVISLCLVGNATGDMQGYDFRIKAAKEAAKQKVLEENSAARSASEKNSEDECHSIREAYLEESRCENRPIFSIFSPLESLINSLSKNSSGDSSCKKREPGVSPLDALKAGIAKEKDCWARHNYLLREDAKALAAKIALAEDEAEKEILAEIALEKKAAAELEKIAAASPERVAAAKDRSLRKNYAAYLEEGFLKIGMSVEVSTYGEEDTFLGFRYIFMTKAIAYSWAKKYREKAKSLGFQGMSFVAYISNHPTTESYSYSIERKLLWRYWGGSEEGLYIE